MRRRSISLIVLIISLGLFIPAAAVFILSMLNMPGNLNTWNQTLLEASDNSARAYIQLQIVESQIINLSAHIGLYLAAILVVLSLILVFMSSEKNNL